MGSTNQADPREDNRKALELTNRIILIIRKPYSRTLSVNFIHEPYSPFFTTSDWKQWEKLEGVDSRSRIKRKLEKDRSGEKRKVEKPENKIHE